MNLETGRIVDLVDNEETAEQIKNGMLEAIADSDMTEKQKETKQVSIHDNRSVLGKKYTSARKARKAAKKSK